MRRAVTRKYEEEQVIIQKKPSVPRAPWRVKKEERDKEKAATGATEATTKPKKKNNKLLATMPDNWEEEEAKFFEMEGDYDP